MAVATHDKLNRYVFKDDLKDSVEEIWRNVMGKFIVLQLWTDHRKGAIAP